MLLKNGNYQQVGLYTKHPWLELLYAYYYENELAVIIKDTNLYVDVFSIFSKCKSSQGINKDERRRAFSIYPVDLMVQQRARPRAGSVGYSSIVSKKRELNK